MDPVTADDVQDLLPGTPAVEDAHVDLAAAWFAGRLIALGRSESDLVPALEVLARTAVAAKALAYKAATGATVQLHAPTAARIIESVKIPNEIEVKFRAAAQPGATLALAGSDWEALAQALLTAAFPVTARPWAFPGASR